MPDKAKAGPLAQSHNADWMLLGVPGLIWGASFLFIAEGMQAVAPLGLTFLRILIGFATLSFFPAARRPVKRSDWLGVASLGVLWMAFPLNMFPFAERNVSSALTGMLNGANPLFTVIVAAAIARRVPSRPVLAGLAVGMTGAILMVLPTRNEGHSSALGVAMILAALVSYGFALNIASPLQRRNGALPVIWRAQMVGLLLTAPLGWHDVVKARWTPGPALSLLALGALGTGVAYVVMSVAAGKLGATRASATIFLIPAVALVLGIVVRHESVSLLSVLGSGMCVGGAWLMRRARGEEERAEESAEESSGETPCRSPLTFAKSSQGPQQNGGIR